VVLQFRSVTSPEFSRQSNEEELMTTSVSGRTRGQKGAIGYILLWAMGVPVSLLLIIFLLRGCT
jgi:hypothetical protein